MNIMLGHNMMKLTPVGEHVAVGINSDEKGETGYIKARIKKCTLINYAMQSIGSHKLSFVAQVADKLYRSVTIPKFTYGIEATQINHETKMVQGLPKQTANPGGIRTMG